MHAGKGKNDTLVFGDGSTDELDNVTITAETKYSTNITNQKRKFV